MITPYIVFWIMWLVGVFGWFFVYPPMIPTNYRPFGLVVWIWIMLALLALMSRGSPFAGWTN